MILFARNYPLPWIIHGDFAVGKSYEFLVSFSKIEPLFERRLTIGKTFFNKMCHESNWKNHLLPDKRYPQIFEKMRHQRAILFHLTVQNAISHLCIMHLAGTNLNSLCIMFVFYD